MPNAEATPAKPPKVFFVLGGPGCGKTTSCDHLVKKFGYTHYSAGDLLRQASKNGDGDVAKEIQRCISAGDIVPDEITVELIKRAMEANPNPKGYLIDGFPRTLKQGRIFEETIARAVGVIYLDCSDETMQKRLEYRRETNVGHERVDDTIEVVRHRFRVHHAQCEPVIEAYKAEGRCYVVDANPHPFDVWVALERLFVSLGEQMLKLESEKQHNGGNTE